MRTCFWSWSHILVLFQVIEVSITGLMGIGRAHLFLVVEWFFGFIQVIELLIMCTRAGTCLSLWPLMQVPVCRCGHSCRYPFFHCGTRVTVAIMCNRAGTCLSLWPLACGAASSSACRPSTSPPTATSPCRWACWARVLSPLDWHVICVCVCIQCLL